MQDIVEGVEFAKFNQNSRNHTFQFHRIHFNSNKFFPRNVEGFQPNSLQNSNMNSQVSIDFPPIQYSNSEYLDMNGNQMNKEELYYL